MRQCRPMLQRPFLTPHQERHISVRACCDPRTVRAYLRGDRVCSTSAARIEAALHELGFTALVRAPSPAAAR